MTESDSAAAAAILQLAGGLWLSRALWVAARLKFADAVDEEPATPAEIAGRSGTDPSATQRVLMALAAFGVFRPEGEDRFAHTPVSRLLRSDHPATQRAFVEAIFGGEHYAAWGAIDAAVRTGDCAFDIHFGQSAFDYYPNHPESAKLFAEAMTGTTRSVEDAVLAAHDFGPFELGVDVGGSEGSLLRRILARTPGARGIVFDLPGAAAEGEAAWRQTPEAGRLQAVGGDFFAEVPAGGDLYLLKFILHDWNDEKAALILANIRKAIRPDGRIALVEMVLPEGATPHPGWLMDLNMLAMTGGRERRLSEYAALLAAAGFTMEGMTPTASPMSVVTATPA